MRAMRALFPLSVAVTVFVVAHGVVTVTGGGSGWGSTGERVAHGLLEAVAGIAMLAGLLMGRRAPRGGARLVAVGAVVVATLWYWAFVVTIPVGIGLVLVAYLRGVRSRPA